ncbi:MAG: hypothetical protein DRP75_03400 [Candidatus Omnitrophota bacterium]|nr:MAG: hypothetical protein DRP75_03400 [Candidatus Omnitrophota bacterium]
MNYRQALAYLASLSDYEQDRGKCRFELKKIDRVLRRLGNPQKRFSALHIAGTNAKGSIGNALYTILKEGGYRVGFFSSPHLFSIRERIRGSWLSSSGLFSDAISPKEFAQVITEIAHLRESRELTFFETLTASTFFYFSQKKVELAIIEAGLGGRLDATNLLHPLACVITPIGWDHREELGGSLEKIAYEKAGIIKRGVEVICAEQKEEVRKVIEDRCVQMKAKLFFPSPLSAGLKHWTKLPPILYNNLCLITAVLKRIKPRFPLQDEEIRRGLEKAYWPGRLEQIRIEKGGKDYFLLLDGGHNPQAMEFLSKFIQERFRSKQIILIFSACRDKEIEEMSKIIFPFCERIIFTRFRNRRAETIRGLRRRTGYKGLFAPNVKKALQTALEEDSFLEPLVLITGSLYLIKEAIIALRGFGRGH